MTDAQLEAPHYQSLSVIVPVYNEQRTVAEIIRRIRSMTVPLDLQVIVVNDGSSDGTDKVLAAWRTQRFSSSTTT